MEIIAYLSMFIDHSVKFMTNFKLAGNPIGVAGRLAFPIFAYLLAIGLKRTRSRTKYLFRIFILALVSQIPYTLMIFGVPKIPPGTILDSMLYLGSYFTYEFNIGFELLLAGILIIFIEHFKDKKLDKEIIIILMLYISETLVGGYGAYGTLIILMFYYIPKEKPLKLLITMAVLTLGYVLAKGFKGNKRFIINQFMKASIQFYSLLALPVILYIKEKPRKPTKLRKIIKYSIYPVHLIIIFLIRTLFFTA